MGIAGTARLLLQNAVWRATGLRPAGRALVRALASQDPTVRTTAGMLLVKGGAAAELLVLEAIRARRSLPLALVVLGDIGGPAAEPVLAALASDRDPAVAEAAREGLRILTARGRPAPP